MASDKSTQFCSNVSWQIAREIRIREQLERQALIEGSASKEALRRQQLERENMMDEALHSWKNLFREKTDDEIREEVKAEMEAEERLKIKQDSHSIIVQSETQEISGTLPAITSNMTLHRQKRISRIMELVQEIENRAEEAKIAFSRKGFPGSKKEFRKFVKMLNPQLYDDLPNDDKALSKELAIIGVPFLQGYFPNKGKIFFRPYFQNNTNNS